MDIPKLHFRGLVDKPKLHFRGLMDKPKLHFRGLMDKPKLGEDVKNDWGWCAIAK